MSTKDTVPEEQPETETSEMVLKCDFCGVEITGYHPNHFSSSSNPHIHACKSCVSDLKLDRYFVDTEISLAKKEGA